MTSGSGEHDREDNAGESSSASVDAGGVDAPAERMGTEAKLQNAVALGAVGLQGHIDAIEHGRIYGWAWNPEDPEERVVVDIQFKGDLIGTVTADRFRQDLADVRMGDGVHAFVFDLPSAARDSGSAAVAAYFQKSQMPLSRKGHGVLPVSDTEPDLMDVLSGRVDRIESSVQNVFRALHVIRRIEADASRDTGPSELEGLHKKIAEIAAKQDRLAKRVEVVEADTNALRSFVERFEIEIHDRVTRNETDNLDEKIRKLSKRLALLMACVVGVLATCVYFLYPFFLP